MYGAGNVVAGKYRIERVLGQGGMGYVVAATHLDLGTPVALKFLHEHMLENQSLVDRFKREARSSAQLRGENVCRVSDVGTAENGQPYIVMELLSGQDLTSVLSERGALPVPMVADIVQQACLALGEAHAVGIVHRDLKPGNLMMTARPDGSMCIKVLDFGVAKGPEDINFSLTQTASVIGSPGYMSPEQLKSSKTADVRSDIWSLGVVMYELVSGYKPFQGESITELALKVAMDPMPPLAGAVPWYFEQVITRCLEKEPARRYADVADLAVALAPFAGTRGHEMAHGVARVLRGAHTPLPVPPSMMPASPTPAPAPVQPPMSTPTTLRGASGMVSGSPTVTVRRNWKVPVIMGGGAVLGVALALILVRGHGHSASNATPQATSSAASSPAATSTPTPAPAHDEAAKDPAAKDQAAKDQAEQEAAKVAAAQKEQDQKNAAAAAKQAEELAKKEAAANAAAAKKADELAKKEAAKEAAANAAAEKAEAAKAAAAKKQAAREAAAKAAAEKKEEALAKKQAAKEAAAKAAAAKAEANKTKTTSTKKTSTTSTTQPKDLGDSRF
ncbi:MAG TPA: serine/threonine-protein kinase [Kofleriaceae bacterium]|nr:serine/threonine-protein kinase [Kofleriaceae bacterium]